MRGKLSEQDLTNYALNDGLDPRERLYVESMLGVSEECRQDVYKMLDLAEALQRGFEHESDRTIPRLTRLQREQLLTARSRFEVLPFVRKAAAALSLAACVAFFIANPAGWQLNDHTRKVTAVTSEMTRLVGEAINSDGQDDYTAWVTPPVGEAETDLIQASTDGMPTQVVETVCTPPTWQETGDFGETQ